jgi:hypothetical protein
MICKQKEWIMKTHETQHYRQIGAWRILIEGFQEDSCRALREIAAAALIFAALFAALFLKEILLLIKAVLG